MNREIMFRVYDINSNQFCPDWFGSNILTLNEEFLYDDVVFLQFIGIKDKHGKKIYEGDVVKYRFKVCAHGDVESGVGEVYYDPYSAAFLFDKSYEYDFIGRKGSEFEVVGNIFENPGLIK